MIYFGERLKQLRKQKNISQKQLGERIHVTNSMISAYETGLRMPSYEVLIKMAYYFHVSTDYLLGVNQKDCVYPSQLTEEQMHALYDLLETFS